MKKIIIGVPTLNSGGVEVSLVRFLDELSKNKEVKITLLLLKKEGLYLDSISKDIEVKTVTYTDDIYSYDKRISDIKNIKGIKNKILFFRYRNKLRKLLKENDWENYYKLVLSKVNKISGRYDLAIDWHGYGHFMTTVIADIVSAKKKAMWIHDEKNEWLDKVDYWLDDYDKIYCVGKSCMNGVLKNKKELKAKLELFYNMSDYEKVREKSLEKIDFKFDKNKINIVTIGRLEWQKAYDVAIQIATILKKKKFNFCWYVIGGGSKKEEIENLIKENSLEDYFKLLNIIPNPFPYVKMADLFVLCSRHEGYCLATLEAKVLGKVIVATDIESNREQIKNGENGFLCSLNPLEFAEKIIEVSNDKKLQNKVIKNLACEIFDYSGELNKIHDLLK